MNRSNRREFIKKVMLGSAGLASVGFMFFWSNKVFLPGMQAKASRTSLGASSMVFSSSKEAMFYRRYESKRVQCLLCPHKCSITDGGRGFCRVRANISGKLYSMVYGKPCTFDIGPIEKAPLYHFIPGHSRLCVATVGCNLRCKYCHNWHISQRGPGEIREFSVTPEQMVGEAFSRHVNSISFTYTEPTVFYEYIYDISRIAQKEGLKVSIVSNGYINPEPMRKLLTYLDAVKIDLKAFSEHFYRDVSSARLEPVLQTLKVLKEEKMFFEIVNLVVPTLNDDADEIKRMCKWISTELGANVPVHFSRFVPTYKLSNLSSTPVRTLERAVGIAHDAGLKYVYIGNVPGHKYNSTYCPKCEKRLIHRTHFSVLSNNIDDGRCNSCSYEIYGIWG